MITGKDLLIYIIENDLLDEPICQHGRLLGFYTESDAAVAFGVGKATIRLWIERGDLNAIKVGDVLFIPKTEKNPIERIKNETNNANPGDGVTAGAMQFTVKHP